MKNLFEYLVCIAFTVLLIVAVYTRFATELLELVATTVTPLTK